ncbi:MarR family winged helix-turn-helix transcriptional regulator [uncultured Lacinutrix sp.]|uniref:MarR family winged helix-turn-helix transcriptional regulator n=1 Tax=uncultured Lacinutrix sp. TaxID=574032 RepID=UPI00260B3047|nr:MarR family winged helix-turn-helix transcriptional regulator [uncultured Lacinutrix sp.]
MNKSVFNPDHQQQDVSSKIVAGLERISEVFKTLLWEKAKHIGLSPIQIQILIFIAYHKHELCNVSHLAKEFNVTKPTISDAIKILNKKEMIIKDYSSPDSRSYTILLSTLGKDIVSQTDDFANPLKSLVSNFEKTDLDKVFSTLSELISKLNKIGILKVQRTCYACKFYSKNNDSNYCNLLEKTLLNDDIRIDCPEFEEKTN